jgi:hypothetical protein
MTGAEGLIPLLNGLKMLVNMAPAPPPPPLLDPPPPPPATTMYSSTVGGVILVSFTVIEPLVATMGPDVLPVRILTVKVSAPSVVESAVVLILKEPVPDVIVKLPDVLVKSALVVVVSAKVQYNVVPDKTFTVLTVHVNVLPSSTLEVITMLYTGTLSATEKIVNGRLVKLAIRGISNYPNEPSVPSTVQVLDDLNKLKL